MKNIWSIVCKNSITDQETNSFSILETLDEINVSYKDKIDLKITKMLPVSFQVVSLWFDENIKKDRKFYLTIEIIDPNNKLLKYFEQECIMPEGNKRLRVITKINGFGFTDKGLYSINLKYKCEKTSRLVSKLPIDINLTKAE